MKTLDIQYRAFSFFLFYFFLSFTLSTDALRLVNQHGVPGR